MRTEHHLSILAISLACFVGVLASFIVFGLLKDPQPTGFARAESPSLPNQSSKTPVSPTLEPLTDFCIDVPVLTYHHIQPFEDADPKNQRELTVTPENFAWHMRYLKEKGYRFISLEEFVTALQSHTPFHDAVVAITLDDAYRDAYTYAYPIARSQGVILNIGVITGLVGNPEHLTSAQITEMHASGFVKFHNHTWSHMNLRDASITSIEQQVARPEGHLTQWIGPHMPILYYPYGVFGDEATRILGEQNFAAAFELSLKRNSTRHCESEMYHLPRLRVGNAGPAAHGL